MTGIWPGEAEAEYLGVDLNEFAAKYSKLFFVRGDHLIEQQDTLHPAKLISLN